MFYMSGGIFILGLFFLFSGEPDLWDNLHNQALENTQTFEVVNHEETIK